MLTEWWNVEKRSWQGGLTLFFSEVPRYMYFRGFNTSKQRQLRLFPLVLCGAVRLKHSYRRGHTRENSRGDFRCVYFRASRELKQTPKPFHPHVWIMHLHFLTISRNKAKTPPGTDAAILCRWRHLEPVCAVANRGREPWYRSPIGTCARPIRSQSQLSIIMFHPFFLKHQITNSTQTC